MVTSIISNQCFGGIICWEYKMQFKSPTVNLRIYNEEFPKFCGNLRHYIDAEVQEYTELSDYHKEILKRFYGFIPDFPMGLCDDILIGFHHYDTFEEAKAAWDRRKARIEWDHIGYLFHLEREEYKDCGKELLDLHLPHTLVLTEEFDLEGAYRFDVPRVPNMDCFGVWNGKSVIEQNFSKRDFLDGKI